MAHPHHVRLELRLRVRSLAELAETITTAWRNAAMPSPTGWSVPVDGEVIAGAAPHAALRSAKSAGFQIGEDVVCGLYQRSGDEHWIFDVGLFGDALASDTLPNHIDAMTRLCRQLLVEPRFLGGSSVWKGGGVSGLLPDVTLADAFGQIVVTTTSEVAEAYDDPDAYWHAWSVERSQERALCTRALAATTGIALYTDIRDGQWAMARAVKAGGCKLYVPLPTEEERPLFLDGEPTLDMVGYVEAEKTVELSCAIMDDTHIRGWEILHAYALQEEGQTDDGRPVENVRVVFVDEAVARRERRPLLDGGLQVFFYDDAGELEALTR